MDGCVFCRIVAGTEPADVVAGTPRALAFCDIAPITPGHVLVVPRVHGAGPADVGDDDLTAVTLLARRLCGALRGSGLTHRGAPVSGVTWFLADGSSAGQDVFHVHLHVIPRYERDGVKLRTGRRRPDTAARAEVAAAVRASLARAG